MAGKLMFRGASAEFEREDNTDETKSGAGGILILAPIAGAFAAGFVSIALFHQGSGWLLNLIGIYPAQYKTQPIPPFAVPQILSQCFWGGLWGIALALTLAHWRNMNYWLLAFGFGLVVAAPQQRHKIIQNRLALVGEESVSGVTAEPPPGQTGTPTDAHLYHRKRRDHAVPQGAGDTQ